MANYELSAEADADFLNIYLYGIENFGFRQADGYATGLIECFQQLVSFPGQDAVAPILHRTCAANFSDNTAFIIRQRRNISLLSASCTKAWTQTNIFNL